LTYQPVCFTFEKTWIVSSNVKKGSVGSTQARAASNGRCLRALQALWFMVGIALDTADFDPDPGNDAVDIYAKTQ